MSNELIPLKDPAAWALGQTPYEVQTTLEACLQRRFGLELVEHATRMWGQASRPQASRFQAICSSTPHAKAAIALVDALMVPASVDQIEGALAAMSTLVARRDRGAFDADLTLATYTAKLRRFPGWLALGVVERWPNGNKFWPVWAELQEKLGPPTHKLTEMRAAISALIEPPAIAAPVDGLTRALTAKTRAGRD